MTKQCSAGTKAAHIPPGGSNVGLTLKRKWRLQHCKSNFGRFARELGGKDAPFSSAGRQQLAAAAAPTSRKRRDQ
jgi:hypothetical protein